MSTLATDTATVFVRELRPVVRDPFSVVFGLVQPLVFLALFGPLLGGTQGPDGTDWLQWFVPGVLVMIALFGSGFTGANLLTEVETGSHEWLLVTPLARSSLLVGRALKEIAPTVAQSLLVLAVTIPFGLDVPPLGALVGLVVVTVFGVGLGALSSALALAVAAQPWVFWLVQQTLLFPLLILSGMLLPLESGPAWLRTAALANPLSHVVDAQRALYAGEVLSTTVLAGLVAALLTAAVGLRVGVVAMRRAGTR